jgi:hypothetical protein
VLAIALAPFYPWIVNIWCESRLERTRFCIGKAFDKFCQEKFSFPAFIFNIDRVSTKAIGQIIFCRVSTWHLLHSLLVEKMARHDPQIERLGQVLDKSLKRMEISTRLDEYGVWPIWNDIVGTTIARNAQPEKIRNGTLFVKVTSPVWMQQLQYMKEMIAEKLNQRLKTDIVKNIFFVVGRVHAETAEVESKPTAPSSAAGQDSRPDEDFLESIRDPEIRQAFKRLLKGYSRRHRKN